MDEKKVETKEQPSNKYRVLHEWSFHKKFMKRAFGEFHKFHIK